MLTRSEQKVFGLSVELSNSPIENYRRIKNHWVYFNQELKKQHYKQSGNWEKFGVTYKNNDKYYYLSSVPSTYQSVSFEQLVLSAGNYLVVQHRGSMDKIKDSIHNVYKRIVPENKISLDLTRTVMHFEHYDYRFQWNKGSSVIDIYIPVARAYV